MMVCSTFLTVSAVRFFFGPFAALRSHEASFLIVAIGAMALVQYFSNTAIIAVGLALKEDQPIFRTWHTHYLGTSITYIVGAAVAGAISNTVDHAGVSVLIVATPIISIVYLTYNKYLDEIKATAAQAEQAEHQRAEAERARAEA